VARSRHLAALWRTIVTTVRIVHWPGGLPEGSIVTGRHLIVLADDTGHRAVPLWLGVVGAKLLRALVTAVSAPGPAEDAVMVGVLQETAARLLHAAGVTVTAVDIEPAGEDVRELRPDTAAARVGLAAAAGARHVQVSVTYGLTLAAAAGAPVRVADEVMDRLGVPVHGEDVLAPFLPPAAAEPPRHPGLRRRPEPRNMAFADGLDYWELAGDFPGDGRPHWRDYSCRTQDGSAVLAAAVAEPAGFAVLVQTIDADDYRGAAVTFRGQLRTTGVVGHAGLYLAVGEAYEPPGDCLRDRGASSLTASGSSDWTWHEVTVAVPDAGVIRFGVSLAGRGRIELRNAGLTPARPRDQE
jgi:hypothetical protein